MVSIELTYNKLKSHKKERICYIYNYILKYLDIIKINSKIKNIIETKVAKKYWFSDINKNIKRVKCMANKIILKDVKEVHLDLKEIHNISAS